MISFVMVVRLWWHQACIQSCHNLAWRLKNCGCMFLALTRLLALMWLCHNLPSCNLKFPGMYVNSWLAKASPSKLTNSMSLWAVTHQSGIKKKESKRRGSTQWFYIFFTAPGIYHGIYIDRSAFKKREDRGGRNSLGAAGTATALGGWGDPSWCSHSHQSSGAHQNWETRSLWLPTISPSELHKVGPLFPP